MHEIGGQMPDAAIIVGLYITDAKDKPMTAVESVEAVAERGLVGDRYFLGTGTYSNMAFWGANVTLIQSEAIQAVNVGHQTDFTGGMLRRNIVTANIKLDTLVGREFQIGAATFRGTKHFPPCLHLAKLLGRREVLKYFAYCGGIGAVVVSNGIIAIHDRIAILDVPIEERGDGDLPESALVESADHAFRKLDEHESDEAQRAGRK
jgi:MOSC domain-containing protein YiiM